MDLKAMLCRLAKSDLFSRRRSARTISGFVLMSVVCTMACRFVKDCACVVPLCALRCWHTSPEMTMTDEEYQQLRDKLREEYDCGLDDVPTEIGRAHV